MDLLETLASTGEYPRITLDEEIRYSQIIQHPDTPESLRQDTILQLILGNRLFIRKFVRQFCQPTHPQYEDTMADAIVGATIAAQRYKPDPNNPGRYISYASFWMKQVILERVYDSRGAAIPAHMRKYLRLFRDFHDAWFNGMALKDTHPMYLAWIALLERPGLDRKEDPTREIIMEALEITDPGILVQMQELQTERISLNAPLHQHDDLALITTLAEPQTLDDTVQQMANENLVTNALMSLEPRPRRMIQYWAGLLDGNQHTLEETGTQFAVVRQQISTLLARAMMLFRQEIIRRS